MKRKTRKRSRAGRAQELKGLFYHSANWRQSFVPLNPALRLDLLSPIKSKALTKRLLAKAKSSFHKVKQSLTSPNKVKQASNKNRKTRLVNKASGSGKRGCE